MSETYEEARSYQDLLERVITSETTSVIRLVWFVIEQTRRGQSEVEASYSELQRELNLSRCGVHSGISRALEAGYLRRIGEPGPGHLRARYALNGPFIHQDQALFPIRPSLNPQVGDKIAPALADTPSDNQTTKESDSNLESLIESSLESLTTFPRKAYQPVEQAGAKVVSVYLSNLSKAFSQELGDESHHRSNRTQVLNLWEQSGLDEKEFAALLYQSRDLTRRYAVLRPDETPPLSGQPRNRMAYFFTVVRNFLSGLAPTFQAKVQPGPVPDRHQDYKANRKMPASWLRYAGAS